MLIVICESDVPSLKLCMLKDRLIDKILCFTCEFRSAKESRKGEL